MNIKIALAGNPNSGKTTMFNALTGSSQYVGNWPGVTVEKKSGKLRWDKEIEIIDLPGIYSLSPYTLEEVVTREYLINDRPDALINILDSTNLERNMYLTTQLLEMGIPVVIALNMTDVIKKKGDSINLHKMSEALGCKIVEISALKGEGLKEAVDLAIQEAQKKNNKEKSYFPEYLENALQHIEAIISTEVKENLRFNAIKLFERDEKALKTLPLSREQLDSIEGIIARIEEDQDDDGESIITSERYNFIGDIASRSVKRKNTSNVTTSDKIDRIVTNRLFALPIFAAIMFLVYYIAISTVGAWGTDWTNDVLFGEIIPPAVENFLISIGTAEWLNSLILDGVIGGVGAVLGFVPQLLVLFVLLSILEDCGYMARVAFIMDRVFRKFGLSGKSFIPMLIGTGCSVPGIMASRTIENDADRRMTIITTSFIPCGAKLPIIALIAGALFDGAWWVAPSAYFLGITAVIVSGIVLKKTQRFAGDVSPFVMELPQYHLPGLKTVLMHTGERGWSFIRKAGTIIFVSCGVIWFLSTFNFGMEMVETGDSMLASLGSLIAPLFIPLGFGNWESAVATLTGFVAKENVVGTFGVLFGFAEVAEDGAEIWGTMATSFTALSAYSFLIFNLLCAPCFAAVGAIRREMGNTGWSLYAITYQTLFAYTIALIVYQLGSFFAGGTFGLWTAVAIALLLGLLYMIFIKKEKKNGELRTTQRAVRI